MRRSSERNAQSNGEAAKAKHDAIDAISAGQSLAKETGGLRIVVIALAGFISAGMVERLRRGEVRAGVEVDPLEVSRCCEAFNVVHQKRCEALATMLGNHVKPLALGGRGDGRQRAEKNAGDEDTLLFNDNKAERSWLIEVLDNVLRSITLHDLPLGVVALQQGAQPRKIVARGAADEELCDVRPSHHRA